MDPEVYEGKADTEKSYPTEAPPEYETIFSVPDYHVSPPPYYEPELQGLQGAQQAGVPRLAYADFLPQCLQPGDAISLPKVEDLRSVMTSVNRWLESSPQFQVIRCESIDRKMGENWAVETDATVWHQGAYTRRNYFVQGIRLWLVPNNQNAPVQKLWYMNAVPKATPVPLTMGFGMGFGYGRNRMGLGLGVETRTTTTTSVAGDPGTETTTTTTTGLNFGGGLYWPAFESLDKLLVKLNSRLSTDPLPGKILTIETVEKKYCEAYDWGEFDPDNLIWWEGGHSYKLYLNILRIFFVCGEADTPQQIGIDDHRPLAKKESSYMLADPIFQKYSNLLELASANISRMQNVKVTNMQSVTVKMQRNYMNATCELDTRRMEMFAGLGMDCSFVKVLRVCYLKGVNVKPPVLSSRIFIPVRFNNGKAESMSQTLWRINEWLNCVAPNIVGVDTMQFEFSRLQSHPINTDRSQMNVVAHCGHYWITGIRLYFSGPFQEPPPEIFPPIPHKINIGDESSSCCTLL